MQKFIAEPSFWEILPEASIGIMVVRAMKTADEVPSEDKTAIASILNEANATANQHLTSNTISENEVVAVWRRAYQLFKTKKGARCSIENLLKRVLKGNPVGSITPSVDIYNAISLKYALPVGGENIDAFVGDFHLGIEEEGGKSFLPIGEEENAPHPARRALLLRRRRSRMSMLQLARWAAHRAHRRFPQRNSRD